MTQTRPTTFAAMAAFMETTLKARDVFFVPASDQPEATAQLVSLQLKEVRFVDHGLSGVYLHLEAVFNSAHGTVQSRAHHSVYAELGVYDLTLGASSARDEMGNTSRTVTCQIARPLLSEALSGEVEYYCGNKASKAAAAAVRKARQTPDYQADRALLVDLDKQIAKLTKNRDQLQKRLVGRETTAQQKVLPFSRAAKGAVPFKVTIFDKRHLP